MLLLYKEFRPAGHEGSKNIVAEVILSDGTSKSYDINTDAEYLRQALEEKGLISGTESDYGFIRDYC